MNRHNGLLNWKGERPRLQRPSSPSQEIAATDSPESGIKQPQGSRVANPPVDAAKTPYRSGQPRRNVGGSPGKGGTRACPQAVEPVRPPATRCKPNKCRSTTRCTGLGGSAVCRP